MPKMGLLLRSINLYKITLTTTMDYITIKLDDLAFLFYSRIAYNYDEEYNRTANST